MGLVDIFKKEQDDRSFIGKNQAVSTNKWGDNYIQCYAL